MNPVQVAAAGRWAQVVKVEMSLTKSPVLRPLSCTARGLKHTVPGCATGERNGQLAGGSLDLGLLSTARVCGVHTAGCLTRSHCDHKMGSPQALGLELIGLGRKVGIAARESAPAPARALVATCAHHRTAAAEAPAVLLLFLFCLPSQVRAGVGAEGKGGGSVEALRRATSVTAAALHGPSCSRLRPPRADAVPLHSAAPWKPRKISTATTIASPRGARRESRCEGQASQSSVVHAGFLAE